MTVKEWAENNLTENEDIREAIFSLNDELTFEDLKPFVVKSRIPKRCEGMFESILTYEKDDEVAFKTCREYQNKKSFNGDSLYKDFEKLSDEELLEEIKFWRIRHKISYNVYTDSDGLTYNSTSETSLDEVFGVTSPKLQFECLKEAEKRFNN